MEKMEERGKASLIDLADAVASRYYRDHDADDVDEQTLALMREDYSIGWIDGVNRAYDASDDEVALARHYDGYPSEYCKYEGSEAKRDGFDAGYWVGCAERRASPSFWLSPRGLKEV